MLNRVLIVVLASLLLDQASIEARSRQKRCIVIQKQSGTHGDSTEEDGGDDEDSRKPLPKDPRPDRLRRPYWDGNKVHDAENISPELSKYKILPMKSFNRQNRLRDKLFRKYL